MNRVDGTPNSNISQALLKDMNLRKECYDYFQ